MKPLALATSLRSTNRKLLCFLPFAKSKTSSTPFELGGYVFEKKQNVVRFGEKRSLAIEIGESEYIKLSRTSEDDPVVSTVELPSGTSAVYDLEIHEFKQPGLAREQMLRIFHGCVRHNELANLQDHIHGKQSEDPKAARLRRRRNSEEILTSEIRLLYSMVSSSADTELVQNDAIRLAHKLTDLSFEFFLPTKKERGVEGTSSSFVSSDKIFAICLWCLALFVSSHFTCTPVSMITLRSETNLLDHRVWEKEQQQNRRHSHSNAVTSTPVQYTPLWVSPAAEKSNMLKTPLSSQVSGAVITPRPAARDTSQFLATPRARSDCDEASPSTLIAVQTYLESEAAYIPVTSKKVESEDEVEASTPMPELPQSVKFHPGALEYTPPTCDLSSSSDSDRSDISMSTVGEEEEEGLVALEESVSALSMPAPRWSYTQQLTNDSSSANE